MELRNSQANRQAQAQAQVQALAPALIKSMQLLPLPYLSLKSFLERAILENPFLEMEMSDGYTVISIEDAVRDMSAKRNAAMTLDNLLSCREEIDSLHELLLLQLFCATREQPLIEAGRRIIHFIDDRGYLTILPLEIAERNQIPPSLVLQALTLIQGFYPKGVGASNLKECLLLQIDPEQVDPAMAKKLLSVPTELLLKKNLKYISRFCGLPEKKIRNILRYLSTLTPCPGEICECGEPVQYICPEIEILCRDGQLEYTIHKITDTIKIDKTYYQQLTSDQITDSETIQYIRTKYKEANELISSLELCFHAVEKLTIYLMDIQRDYFMSVSGKLKALTMHQAAESIGVSDSTISRCVNGRYIRTIHGVTPLKHLFSTGLSSSGETKVSSFEVKKMIQNLIYNELPGQPITDQEISKQLNNQGIAISRRTVAKYRTCMGIQGSKDRKGKDF